MDARLGKEELFGIKEEHSKETEHFESNIETAIPSAAKLTAIPSPKFWSQTQQQVHKQQHLPPSKTQQEVVGGEGASTKADWVISIRGNLAGQDDKLIIYKVPHHLREGDDKAYVPQIVSLGPYHQGKEHLRQMDRQKGRALQLFLKRKNEDIKIYLNSIKELEEEARGCYEGPIDMSNDDFVLMMVLDGCFVLEVFRVTLEEHLGYGRSEEFEQLYNCTNDPLFKLRVSRNLKLIQRDMIMLENQIPLFILDRLLGLQLGRPDQRGLVAKLAVNFFRPLMPAEESPTKSNQNRLESSPEGLTAFDPYQGLHFLDVFRRSLLHTGSSDHANSAADKRSLKLIHCLLHIWPGSLTGCSGHANRAARKRPLKPIHCVTELRDAGIKFKKRDDHLFWDINFANGGVLEIPTLVIDDVTKSLFPNLIAFEQCHLDCSNNISSYVVFMDHLINSSEDVRHLHHCGIIEHWLGSDDKVAELFNRLCQEVVLDINGNYYSEIYDKVNSYCGHRRHRWCAYLKHKHCSNPWVILSIIAGVGLLLLTSTQTFYAIYGYHRPS